jgi:hypothetical protein
MAAHEDQHWDHEESGMKQCSHQLEDASQTQIFQEPCKMFDHQQLHPALWLQRVSGWFDSQVESTYKAHKEQHICQLLLLQHCR